MMDFGGRVLGEESGEDMDGCRELARAFGALSMEGGV